MIWRSDPASYGSGHPSIGAQMATTYGDFQGELSSGQPQAGSGSVTPTPFPILCERPLPAKSVR